VPRRLPAVKTGPGGHAAPLDHSFLRRPAVPSGLFPSCVNRRGLIVAGAIRSGLCDRFHRLEDAMAFATQLKAFESRFGMETAEQLLAEIAPAWVQDLGLLVESVEPMRPPGAPADWQPGVTLRLPFTPQIGNAGGLACSQALMALADTAMVLACSAAWNGYRAVSIIDQTTHFLRPATFDVVADARVLRLSHAMTFGRVTICGAADRRPVATVASAYAML
jgi:acyl-coenzyme A thioesterase PaaI-like protein